MEITNELLDRLAYLSRLQIGESERTQVKAELEQILSYMGQIEKLELAEKEEAVPMGKERLREDEIQSSLSREKLLKNAPDTDGTYWMVPKTVE